MGFAFWYMDDGSTTGYGFDITTFDVSLLANPKDTELVFRNILGLEVSVTENNREGKIHILKESHDLAWSYIQPHLVSCFSRYFLASLCPEQPLRTRVDPTL